MQISYNNLPNEGSQAGQIISLTESRNKCHPIPLELIKNQRSSYVYTSSRNLLLSDRCDVTFYVNKLLSELIHTDKVSLKVTTFTDNQSLHNTHHSTIQTLVKWLAINILFLSEMINQNELTQLVPFPYSCGRSTLYSDTLHDFSVTIPRSYRDVLGMSLSTVFSLHS